MDRPPYLCLQLVDTDVPQVKAANPSGKVIPILGRWTFWLCGYPTHCSREERRIATPAFDSPTFGA